MGADRAAFIGAAAAEEETSSLPFGSQVQNLNGFDMNAAGTAGSELVYSSLPRRPMRFGLTANATGK
jgi:hypothetical protein